MEFSFHTSSLSLRGIFAPDEARNKNGCHIARIKKEAGKEKQGEIMNIQHGFGMGLKKESGKKTEKENQEKRIGRIKVGKAKKSPRFPKGFFHNASDAMMIWCD